MPKRNYVTEDPITTPSSTKRARTADSDEEVTQTQIRSPKRGLQKDMAKKRLQTESFDEVPDDAEDEDEGEDEGTKQPQLLDDEEFEAKYGAALRAHLEKKRNVQGGVAEYGIIEYIEMHQFMCHKYLSFTFGPQINFIIGHNGSGKSAVLSAITVALGGKTASTGRGTGLKSFIREGQNTAEVTIHIKNQGEEAYKPKEYGKTIIITRKWSKEGSTSWKIKNKEGRVISSKKDELAAICDHMNIQVDNPMNVLTQDAARQFLSASSPQDKYKFFLRGTQLTQLSDEYDLCYGNVTQTQKLLAVKREALPDLKARLCEATARYNEAEKAREQKKRADDLKKELAWSHVATKQEEMSNKMEETAKLARRLPKIEEGVKQAESALDNADQEVSRLEAEHRDLGSVDSLINQRQQIQEEMNTRKQHLRNFNADLRQMDASLQTTKMQIQEIDKQIDAESRRMASHTQAKHEETQRKIDDKKATMGRCDQRLRDIMYQRKSLGVEVDTLKQRGADLESRKPGLQEHIRNCEGMIKSAKDREKDALVPYGKNIKMVLEKIKSMRWFGDMPLGPLGQYVKAKDAKIWGDILRNQLGHLLCAFAVTDARDRIQLKRLLQESSKLGLISNIIIILIYEKDLFDYKSGEPPEHLHTVLRALDISDPYVLRLLINQARIENQILAPTRREAEATLRTVRGGHAWSLDKFAVRVFPDGGVASSPLNMRRKNDSMSLLLTGRDTAADIRHFSEEKIRFEAEYTALIREIDQIKAQWTSSKKEIDQLNKEDGLLQSQYNEAKRKSEQLIQEANEDLPAGLTALEASKLDAEKEKAGLVQQAETVMRQKNEIDNEQMALLQQMNAIKERLNEFEGRRNEKNKQIEAAVEARMEAQKNKKYYEDKFRAEKAKVDAAEETANVLEKEFKNWSEKAAEYCEQVPNPRKPDDVKRLLDSVQKALKDQEKRHGASVEEMAKEVNKAQESLNKADKELKQMSMLNKALKQSLMVRIARWQDFRMHIALRCKHVFQYHLSQRGYYGKILFNHENGSLQLRVQTDDQLQTQGPKDKDPRSLSGGEKSFSTICLLLSLWESIGCPLRCLDEFDVFMDAINRRISMRMMIDTANTSDKKQYILITPQDMTNVLLGPTVKVLRMPDPERGNGMLPFGSSSS